MIPRNLPALTATAVRGGWDVSVEHHPDLHAVVTAKFGHGMTLIEMVWSDAHLDHSTINGTPTSYQQCVRLIRSEEPWCATPAPPVAPEVSDAPSLKGPP